MTALSHGFHIAGRHTKALIRQPWYILASLTQPLLWLLLFGQLFKEVSTLPGFPTGSYIAYLTPGVVVMTAMFANSWNGMSLLDDMDSGVLDRFLASPVRRSAILTGVSIQQTVSVAIQSLILVALALVLGARFEGGVGGVAILIAVSTLLGAGFGGISMGTALSCSQKGIGHRHEPIAGAARCVPIDGIHASRPAARLDRNRRPVQPGELGRRRLPRGSARNGAGLEPCHVTNRAVGPVLIAAVLLGTTAFRSYQRST